MDASDIPSSLKKATAVTLTGTWDSNAFNLLCMAMMDNPAFVTSENTVLQKVDMSAARIAEGTSCLLYTSIAYRGGHHGVRQYVAEFGVRLAFRLYAGQ